MKACAGGVRAGYHPVMMLALLVYAYCVGKPSSRKIERATYEDVAFRVLSGDQHPDHDSLAAFRKDNLAALAGLFTQVLRLVGQPRNVVTIETARRAARPARVPIPVLIPVLLRRGGVR